MEETETFLDPVQIYHELYDLKQKYDRLKESHRKLLSVNQNLEDKLLQNINRYETEKFSLIHTISSVNLHLEELQQVNQKLLAENERIKLDISVAIQLLHCKPSSFSACKLDSLPPEYQAKAKFHIQQETTSPARTRSEKRGKVIRVPISAFPSTTVIYSVPGDDDEDDDEIHPETTVPPETMAKVLEERQRELHSQTANGTRHLGLPSGGLHPSRSMPFLDGMQYVDHGTQTYPKFIGERDKTINTCIFCQGSANRPSESSGDEPVGEPKVFVYTESETKPLTMRSSMKIGGSLPTQRRKLQTDTNNASGSMETEI